MQIEYYTQQGFIDMGTMLGKTAMNNRKSNNDVPVHMVFRAIKGFVERPGVMEVFWEMPFDKSILRDTFNEPYSYFAGCLDDIRSWDEKDIAVFAKYNKDDPDNMDLAIVEYKVNGRYIYLRPVAVAYLMKLFGLFVQYGYRGRSYLLNLGVDIQDPSENQEGMPKHFCLIGFEDLVDLAQFIDDTLDYLEVKFGRTPDENRMVDIAKEIVALDALDISEETET